MCSPLRNDAWAGYGGGTLYTRAKTVPADILERVKEATAKANVPYDRFWKARLDFTFLKEWLKRSRVTYCSLVGQAFFFDLVKACQGLQKHQILKHISIFFNSQALSSFSDFSKSTSTCFDHSHAPNAPSRRPPTIPAPPKGTRPSCVPLMQRSSWNRWAKCMIF